MKYRIVALVLILFATALMISPHLIVHEDIECHRMECLACQIRAQRRSFFACILVLMAGMSLLNSARVFFLGALPEKQTDTDRTPVHLKVKLLN